MYHEYEGGGDRNIRPEDHCLTSKGLPDGFFLTHARIQTVLPEGVQLWQRFFKLMRGGGSKYHFKRAIIGPPAKRHLNGVSLACRCWPNIECWLGSFVIFQGIRTSIAKKPFIFVIFQGGPASSPPPLSGSAHVTHPHTDLFFNSCSPLNSAFYFKKCFHKFLNTWRCDIVRDNVILT